jgi:GNAT superfamily N-acetyltransferase
VIVEAVTDATGAVVRPELLAAAEPVHRQLRPHLPAQYRTRLEAVFATGAEMAVAREGERVVGVAVFRVIDKTSGGRELYCDDLVTDEGARSKGAGRAMIAYMERVARERDCAILSLDSGTHRPQAHRFYFREGLAISAFHFLKKLT